MNWDSDRLEGRTFPFHLCSSSQWIESQCNMKAGGASRLATVEAKRILQRNRMKKTKPNLCVFHKLLTITLTYTHIKLQWDHHKQSNHKSFPVVRHNLFIKNKPKEAFFSWWEHCKQLESWQELEEYSENSRPELKTTYNAWFPREI